MKKRKNKDSHREQQQDIGNKRTGTENQRTTGSTETPGTPTQTGAINTPEKKPISHRTGDATNFGDRSYRED